MLGDVFYRVGQVLGQVEARAGGGDGQRIDGDEPDDLPPEQEVADAALSAAAAWLAARLLRPKPVRWSRVVLAGAAGALLSEMVGRVQDDGRSSDRLPYARDPAELMGRIGAGVAVAAGYASILYPRLPGSPLTKGLAFGALEIAAAPRGGLVRLATEMPGLRFPLQALALPVDEDASPAAHLAFGLALGLLYRGVSEDEDYEDADYDDEDYEDEE